MSSNPTPSEAPAVWRTARFDLALDEPRIMGIVNLTPDSFSDGGSHVNARAALAHCEQLLKDGAHLLDIGGESTRPGARPLPLDEELARVMPVLREAVRLGVPVSVDTYKAGVMRAALDVGADAINDVWALRQPGARDAVAAHPRCGVCLMHMHGEPETMQVAPMSGDPIAQVLSFWKLRVADLRARGIEPARISLDPGIGFGKTPAQNFALLARQRELLAAGLPLLVGWSRKSSLGHATGLAEPRERLVPSVAAALLAAERGARILRVHDARETALALAVWRAARPGAG